MQLGDRFLSTRTFTAAGAEFRLPSPASGIGQCLGDVLGLEVRIFAEYLVPCAAGGDEADHRADRYTHAPMHGFPPITAGSRVIRVS
jgi:hypothetical protein